MYVASYLIIIMAVYYAIAFVYCDEAACYYR